ncbi:hypothetical protein FisN_15Hh138 [Fistulifera solaris]|uniref:Uncharacterized protein n=1 Tax=Fistulifera solaris TaxID=1519565 RepID=A0A1Z5K9M8_FISSO|nr:hypothetical protein FisN_15Hh138 [Fistulifera solaris]|eukprot:GAX22967.1 hypothetical protein FisN_15Hh138 [Fistulifera solaris]
MKGHIFLLQGCFMLFFGTTHALEMSSNRRSFFRSVAAGVTMIPSFANASERISDKELREIVKADILERQFLVTGQITRSIYLPTATFTDEIDTYKLDQWVKGTAKLFVGEQSNVRLIGDVDVSADEVKFRFDEDLMFRIPFRPIVSLSGTVVLARDATTGLISSYREIWDQDVATVLKSAKFK